VLGFANPLPDGERLGDRVTAKEALRTSGISKPREDESYIIRHSDELKYNQISTQFSIWFIQSIFAHFNILYLCIFVQKLTSDPYWKT